jgi:uncharacterized membrane protein
MSLEDNRILSVSEMAEDVTIVDLARVAALSKESYENADMPYRNRAHIFQEALRIGLVELERRNWQHAYWLLSQHRLDNIIATENPGGD